MKNSKKVFIGQLLGHDAPDITNYFKTDANANALSQPDTTGADLEETEF